MEPQADASVSLLRRPRGCEQVAVLVGLMVLLLAIFVPLEWFSTQSFETFNKRRAHFNSSAIIPDASTSSARARSTPPGLSTNYASKYLGAILTDAHPSCQGASTLLVDNTDKYMMCPCGAAKKQFSVQLIRDVEVRVVTVINKEHFSSGVRRFTLLGSRQYPTNSWEVLGNFEAQQRRGRQSFEVAQHSPVRFIRLLWVTSHGSEPWCTMTGFQVFGIDALETLTRYDIDEEVEGELESCGGTGFILDSVMSSTSPDPTSTIFKEGASARERFPSQWPTTLVDPIAPLGFELSLPTFNMNTDADARAATHAMTHDPAALCLQPPSPTAWNASIQCTAAERPGAAACFTAMCAVPPRSRDPHVTRQTLSSTLPSPITYKSTSHANPAVNLLVHLIKQQKALQAEFQALAKQHADTKVELMRVRQELAFFAIRNRDSYRRVAEAEGHVYAAISNVRNLAESLLSSEGVGLGGVLLIAVLACIMSALSIFLVFTTTYALPAAIAAAPMAEGLRELPMLRLGAIWRSRQSPRGVEPRRQR